MEEGKEYTIQDFCNLLNLKPSRTKELLKALTTRYRTNRQ